MNKPIGFHRTTETYRPIGVENVKIVANDVLLRHCYVFETKYSYFICGVYVDRVQPMYFSTVNRTTAYLVSSYIVSFYLLDDSCNRVNRATPYVITE